MTEATFKDRRICFASVSIEETPIGPALEPTGFFNQVATKEAYSITVVCPYCGPLAHWLACVVPGSDELEVVRSWIRSAYEPHDDTRSED